MRRELWLGVLLAVLTLGVYWPVRTHDFILYDDPQFITENPQIQSGLSWKTVVYAFTTPIAGNWHPVTSLSHALDCELFGPNPGADHLVNALLHALNGLLLFLLLRQWFLIALTDKCSAQLATTLLPESTNSWSVPTWAALFAALLFALHPLRVESVAWIAERKDLLSGLFFFLTLWLYTRYVQLGKRPQEPVSRTGLLRRRSGFYYFLAVVSFAFGLMSKPMLVTLPFVLLLLDYWPFQRLRTLPARVLLEKLPFLLLSIVDCWITLAVQRSAGAMQVIVRVTWLERISNALTSYLRYLGKFFWPADLSIVYPHPAKHYYLRDQWPGWEIAAAALLLVLLSVFCLSQARRRPYLAVGWFWYLGMLVPVIGLVQVGEQAMADRYTYLPLIGPVMALAWWLTELPRLTRASSWRKVVPVPSSNPLPNRRPDDPPTDPGNSTPVALGRPVWNWGIFCATALLLAALTRHQLAFWNNTVTLFGHAIDVTADNPSAQFALGAGLERQGQVRQAIVHYRMAVAIDSHYAKAYYNLGQIFRKTGQWQAAADAYLAAARANPADQATQLNLASVLPQVGRPREAVAHFDQALRTDPNSIEALNNLAWLLATCSDSTVRDGTRAVQLAERGCNLTGYKMPVLLGTLAAAYAEAGRFGDAVTTAQNACALAAQAGDTTVASKNQELLQLYRANKPFRDGR